jgi:pimeloyl-ACP methyl ester carboxylesterase
MSRPFPSVPGVEHSFVEAGGLRMHVAEAGEGEPLVMLHGWPQHWYEWRHQIPPLARHYRVICPDLRGLGWSDAPARGYEKENLARDVVNLLDTLGLERVRLVGHDWGGWVGFLICLYHPERVERFLALDIPPPWSRPSLRNLPALPLLAYQWLLASPLGYYLLRHQPGLLRRLIGSWGPGKGTWSEEELGEFVAVLQEPARARATQQIYRTFTLSEFPKLARGAYNSLRLVTPTLLLIGERDFTRRLVGDYEPFVDDLELEIVPDAGHFLADEKPELVTRRVFDFFGAPVQTASA